jgi:2-methylcitrate dehydratase PrpD
MAARNGVNAALLVDAGWTGVDDILSGADSFLDAYGPETDPAKLVEGLGSQFEIVRTNIKKGPSARRSRRRWMRCGS